MKIKIVYILAILFYMISYAGPKDHEEKGPKNTDPSIPSRPSKPVTSGGEADGCGVDPGELASVANGENQNLSSVITFLTAPACVKNHLPIARSAVARGVQFNQMPFRLDQLYKTYTLASMQSAKKLDAMLRKMVPEQMDEHSFTVQEQIPLVAQFSLLSQNTGTWALGNLIKDEIIASQSTLKNNGNRTDPEELAKNIISMGGTENTVVNELVTMVEELALLSQADALGKVLKGLASAASVEGSIVPVFNAAANAYKRGVEKGKNTFSNDQTRNLTSAGLEGAKEAIQGNSLLNAGVTDMNDAFKALLEGKNIETLQLKNLWKEIVRALALTPLLPNLAEMIATSITPQVAFLQEKERKLLFNAAKNYPALYFSIQKNMLLGWDKSWDALHSGRISAEEFNNQREKFYKPAVNELLEADSGSPDEYWLSQALKRGLIKDELIEKKFPSFVLNLYERREKAMKLQTEEPDLEKTLSGFAEDLSVLWSLSRVYIPALKKWVVKYDE